MTTAINRRIVDLTVLVALLMANSSVAQNDPWTGTWRGDLTTPQGATTEISLTIVPSQGGYLGVIVGFTPNTEIRLTTVEINGPVVTLGAATKTRFGPLSFLYQLTNSEQRLSGEGHLTLGEHSFEVSLELTRARRADVPQPQIEPSISYFSGTWDFEYTGGEFPPLSAGTRSGTVTFEAMPHGPFVQGSVTGEVFGEPYAESLTIGFDEAAGSVLWHEQLSNGRNLIAVGNWSSPIAINFLTTPMSADSGMFILRRMIHTPSETAFSVVDEFSVNGEPFRRLGSGFYTKTNGTNLPD